MEYRSLEHKIRDLWIAEANRNTEMRRKVANVGRPTDNVKDETSKLGKQGEIKTKIIDEAADGDIGKEVDSKKKDNSDSKKKPKDSDMDDMEAKTIKGGKTEVDTEPKTDDSTENSTDEDKKSKKATNKENKKIGAKGVKEETMSGKLTFGSSQSLIDSITEAMKKMKDDKLDEKLVGNQHKIDANKNGKIDAQDFKILKGKKKVEEEVEAIDEGNPANKKKKNAAVSTIGGKDKDTHWHERMKKSVADKIRGREVTSGKERDWREEVELSAEELARIDAIAEAKGMSRREAGAHWDANKKSEKKSDEMAEYKNKTQYQKAAMSSKKKM